MNKSLESLVFKRNIYLTTIFDFVTKIARIIQNSIF